MKVFNIVTNSITSTNTIPSKHLTVLLILLITISNISTISGQNFSGLQNKKLTKIEDVGSLLESGLGILTGAKDLKGKIEKVLVLEDRERQLKLQVFYSGFEGAYIKGNILDGGKRPQREIALVGKSLAGASSPIEMSFLLDESLPEGTKLESSFLKLTVLKAEKDLTGLVTLFSLPKQWQIDIKPENLVISIELEPVGSAALLPPNEKKIVLPPRSQTFEIDKVIKAIPKANIVTSVPLKPVELSPLSRREVISQPEKTVARPGTPPAIKEISPQRFQIVKWHELGLKQEEVDKGAQGPSNNPLSLWEELHTDRDFDFGESYKITNIRMDIYPDKNEASGIYYYLPAAYYLQWETDEGYKFRMLYGTADEEGGTGTVHMASTLTPGVSTKERDFIKALLEAYTKGAGKKFEKLRAVPIQEAPDVSFAGVLSYQYEIPVEKVNVNVTSSLFDPIQVSWVTDSNTKDEMQVALLENVGIHGKMTLKAQGDVSEQQIPIYITLADPRTLGRFDLDKQQWRKDNWRNETPYPLQLKYLHMLMVEKDKQNKNKLIPIIYSWNLNDTEVPSQAQVTFDTKKVPGWIDKKTERIWLEYTVVSCDTCVKKVIDEITGGTAGSRLKQIAFESIGVLERTGATVLQVRVRSLQADPQGRDTIELPMMVIKADEKSYTTGPLYVPEGKEPEFEYKIMLVTSDETHESTNWISTNNLTMYLNKSTIKEALGFFPGEDSEEKE